MNESSTLSAPISMTAGRDASPARKPIVIVTPPQEQQLLFLTNHRSFQQNTEKINEVKRKLRGKKFRIKKVKPFFCRSNKIALFKTAKGIITDAKFTRIPCNSWTCPECSFHKALKLKYYFREVIQLNKLAYFLTLTLDPEIIPIEYKDNTHKYITKIFNHFLTILKRNKVSHSQEVLKYVWVIEFQKKGNAHMHILLNNYLPIRVVRKLWQHVGGGIQMKVKRIKTLIGISNYISNYIVKGIKEEFQEKPYGFKYFERRYSISKSCTRPTVLKKMDLKKLSLLEKTRIFQKLDISWVYNTLYEVRDKDIIIHFESQKS